MKYKPWFHRKEQWDLDCWPFVCVHLKSPNRSKRIFCLWSRGIEIGNWRYIWKRKK